MMPRFILLPLCLTLLLWMPNVTAVQVTAIRLMNGTVPSIRLGRVEIQVNNNPVWGSICDDGWDNKEAIVVCRSLGFTNGGTAVTDTRFGTGSYNFLMDDSSCTGDEQTLSECQSSQQSDCTRATDTEAGVVCNENLAPGQPTPTPIPTTTAPGSVISGNCQQTSPTVRLYGRQGVDGMGFVEVLQPNTAIWGFVCDDGWSSMAAKIVCAQLCYPTNYTAKPGIPAEFIQKPVNPNVILDNVNCFGNETTLQNCSHAAFGAEDCLATDGELAGVQCVAAPYLPPPAPVPNLICGEGKMVAQFSRAQDPNLEAKHLSVANQPNCPDATTSTTTDYVSMTIPVNKCGTALSRNGTHIIYRNVILYDSTSQEGAITRVNTYRVQITCILPVDVEVTQRIQPLTQAVTQSSVGIFPVSLTIYRNDSFTVPATENPVQIPLGEYLNIAFSMDEYDPNLKLVVTDCVASPTGDLLGTVRKVLFANKCSQEDSLSFYPLSNFRFGFRFKPFKFVGYDILYIHCNATICLAADNTQECDRTCANIKTNVTSAPTSGRRRRSAQTQRVAASSQAIFIYDPHAPGPNFDTGDGSDPKDDINLVIGANDPSIVQSTVQETTTKIQQQENVPTSKTQQQNMPTSKTQQENVPTSKTQQENVPTSKTQQENVPTSKTQQQENVPTSKTQQQENVPTSKTQQQENVPTSKAQQPVVSTSRPPQQQNEASSSKAPQQQNEASSSKPQNQQSAPLGQSSDAGGSSAKTAAISLHTLFLLIILLAFFVQDVAAQL